MKKVQLADSIAARQVMRKEEQAKEKKFFFENKDNLKRDAIHKKHGSMLLKAAGGEPIQTKGKNKKLPTC